VHPHPGGLRDQLNPEPNNPTLNSGGLSIGDSPAPSSPPDWRPELSSCRRSAADCPGASRTRLRLGTRGQMRHTRLDRQGGSLPRAQSRRSAPWLPGSTNPVSLNCPLRGNATPRSPAHSPQRKPNLSQPAVTWENLDLTGWDRYSERFDLLRAVPKPSTRSSGITLEIGRDGHSRSSQNSGHPTLEILPGISGGYRHQSPAERPSPSSMA
jgi:hypothetical protein